MSKSTKSIEFYKDYQNFQLLVSPALFPDLYNGDGTCYAKINLNGYYDLRLESFAGYSRVGTYAGSNIVYPAILQSSLFSSPMTAIPNNPGIAMPLNAFTSGALFIPTQDFELDYSFNNVYINGGFFFRIGQGTTSEPFVIRSSLWQANTYNSSIPPWNNNSNILIQFSYKPSKASPSPTSPHS
jgi:hypothetical protein